MRRRLSLTARSIDLLERLSFAVGLLKSPLVPRPMGLDPASPKPLDASVDKLQAEARALIAEYHRRT